MSGDKGRSERPPSVDQDQSTQPVQRRPAPSQPETLTITAERLPAPPPAPASEAAPPASGVDPFSATMASRPPPALSTTTSAPGVGVDPFRATFASQPPPAPASVHVDPYRATFASQPPPAPAPTGDSQLAPTHKKAPPVRRASPPPLSRTLRSAAPQSTPSPLLGGQVLSGRYLLLRQIGAGGMGQVYKGEHVKLGTPVAIKTMHPHVAANEDDRRRFLREARAASMLRHPNVVQVLDCDEDDGQVYLVMEFVEGRSLGAWLHALGALPKLAEVAEILGMILDALELSHANGIVHRDLKPDNVLLTDVGGKRVAKVTDFGIAHFDDALDAGPTLTSRDMIAGTPEYMSPEQCRSLQVGPSSDLYAIGCILTTMLQGRPPFSGGPPVDIMTKHLFTPPPPLDRPAGAEPVPPLLERLRMDLLAKHPDRRPPGAAETRARLEAALSPEAEEAQLPGRKQGAPLGGRMERAPAWTATQPSAQRPAEATAAVALLRAGSGAAVVDEGCATGLMAQGLEVRAVDGAAALAALASAGCPAVVIDAGADVEAAGAMLAAIAAAAPRVRAVVCAAGIGADRLSALVAAGAADVVRAPVTADVLGRKLWRVIRRGR